tara:strand:+ start:140 stop:772 length:633 start_codon:yes stop_codon:yes gene_type:complete
MELYNVLLPFGPSIYHSVADSHEQSLLNAIAESTTRSNISKGKDLAGNIKTQLTVSYNEIQQLSFLRFINSHIKNYVKERMIRVQQNTIVNNVDPTVNAVQYDLGSGPWINYQRQHEFNPVHKHAGALSGICMINVPIEIAGEVNSVPIDSNMRCSGQLEFQNNNHTHKIIPKTGDIFLFDADLQHQVYPFSSDVVRITMSFNVYNLTYN